jgi:hypothetical protein
MNTKTITDKTVRKVAKRKARKAAEEKAPLQPRPATVARGSMKKKVKKIIRGQRKR